MGTFSHPALLGGYLAMTLPLAASVLQRTNEAGWRKAAGWIQIIAMALVLMLSQSLGAVLALAAAWAIVYWRFRGGGASRRTWVAWLVICVAVVGVLFAARPSLQQFTHRHNPFHNRLQYWTVTASMIQAHPLRGVGLGQFESAYIDAARPTNAPLVRHAHNSYLELWVELGLGGLLVWLWIIWSGLQYAQRSTKLLAIAGWTFALHNLVDVSFYMPQAAMLWWVIVGLAVAYHRTPPHPTASP